MLLMAMNADDMLAHPALGARVRGQAHALLLIHQANPPTASLFSTQRRWLMAQMALAAYFRNEEVEPGSGLLTNRFVDLVAHHELANRNIAAGFVREMLKYGIVRHVAASKGRRYRPVEPSPRTLAVVGRWLAVHLATLDGLDGGVRSATLCAQPTLLGRIQPAIADGLVVSRAFREPDETLSVFTWIDDGGIVMDRVIAGCPDDAAGLARIPTDVTSVSGVARGLNASRSQLSRKFAAAETMGNLGWSGAKGKSTLWVSAEFWREYHVAQAVKLAVIDAAFAAVVRQPACDPEFRARISA
jgi:hypothetical protein